MIWSYPKLTMQKTVQRSPVLVLFYAGPSHNEDTYGIEVMIGWRRDLIDVNLDRCMPIPVTFGIQLRWLDKSIRKMHGTSIFNHMNLRVRSDWKRIAWLLAGRNDE